MTSSWLEHIRNPHSYVIKKYLADMLKGRYASHDQFINRLAAYMMTEEDVHNFGKLMVEIFEAGFMKAFQESQQQFKNLGYNVEIKAEEKKPEATPIFPQEKSG